MFEELYDEWFANTKYWFCKTELQKTYDKYLSDKYFHYIEDLTSPKSVDFQNKKMCIGAIIAYDQIPRHHNRISKIDCDAYSQIAKEISTNLILYLNQDTNRIQSMRANEWCFVFLPFRHVRDLRKMNGIIDFIIFKYNTCEDSSEKNIFKRFLQNAINDVYKLNTTQMLKTQNDKKQIVVDNSNSLWNSYKDILHHCPPSTCITCSMNYGEDSEIIKTFYSEMKKINKNTHIIVSISGGVDSCVCLHLLKQFLPDNKITAVHINYNNRSVCKSEVSFIRKYCSLMGVDFYHRDVTELARESCHLNGMRDIYENSTRNIRYDTYRQVAEMFPEYDYMVMLGHNLDDCFENIIANISTKKHYNNLCGTSILSNVGGICFWRPLLNIRKSDIVKYAINMNIPYLKDSTPKWSMRGKIRDNVLPKMEEINTNIVKSFFALKDYMSRMEHIVDSNIIPSIMKKFSKTNEGIIGEFSIEDLVCDFNIWSKLFRDCMFDDLLDKKISHRCVEEFVMFLERFKNNFPNMQKNHTFNQQTKFVLKKDVTAFICRTKNNQIRLAFSKKV